MQKYLWLSITICYLLLFQVGTQAESIKVAYFSQDPPSVDPLSPSFDPDSYAVIAQIFDSLVHMDLDGHFKPALATSWKQLSDTRWHFTLRQGVKFHNGEKFDSKAVKFTFDYILNPKNNAGNRWIFNSLKSVQTIKGSPHEVIFETHFPDGMFLNRFNLFGSICPPEYIKRKGFEEFQKKPIGTGPFKFAEWKQGQAISLTKNSNYWQSNRPHLNNITFVLEKQSDWIAGFNANRIDFIPNLGGNLTTKFLRSNKGEARIIKRPVLSSYWVMLKNVGPLADIRVRQALNHALNKNDLIKFADFGNALPMASMGKIGEFGANEELTPYQFSPSKARELLIQAGVKKTLKLKVLVADVAESAAKIIQRNLLAVGVELEMEVVSRSEWTKRVVVHKIITGKRPDFDMVINLVDNPIYNLSFHAGLFLESTSPWSLLDLEEFDKQFVFALKTTNKEQHEQRLKELDKYIHENALMLFTSQKIITAAIRNKYSIRKFGGNGHLNYEVLTNAKLLSKE